MPTEIEALTQVLFDACDECLGDTITITPPAGAAITCAANVAYGEEAVTRGISAAIVQQIEIDVARWLVPGEPGPGWRVALPKLPGMIFEPIGTIDDPRGAGLRWWFRLKRVPNG